MGRQPRILCVMGSGETAPTMVSVHAELLGRMGPPPVPAVLLDTPFGFQENADDVAGRAQAYFRHRVGSPVEVATFRDATTASALEYETMLARVGEARYVFSGPGSPTYALRQWRDTALPEVLTGKLREGGCITFASAAACALGAYTPPVYEMYKVGEMPYWNQGLDVFSALGLRVAVIPHYNNAEGGTHDTRYCYIGERRLRMLETMLPDDARVLGVDEHTACIFDLDAQTMLVRGRGAVTWRRRGVSRQFASGSVTPLATLTAGDGSGVARQAPAAQPAPRAAQAASTPFREEVARQTNAAGAALVRRDVEGAVAALLALETQLHEWASDTFDSDEQDQARAHLRGLVVRLGHLAHDGSVHPRDRLAPLVESLLSLREQLRAEAQYALADRLRDVLLEVGVEVRDSREGAAWGLSGATS